MRISTILESEVDQNPLHAKIAQWLEVHGITSYKINADDTVDVQGDVIFMNPRFKKLPFQFGQIDGDLQIAKGFLVSSWGFPRQLTGSLSWHAVSESVDISHFPEHIGGDLVLPWMKRKSLAGCGTKSLGGSLYLTHAAISSYEGLPKRIGGSLFIKPDGRTGASDIEHLPEYIGEAFNVTNLINVEVLSHIPTTGEKFVTMSQIADGTERTIKITADLSDVKHLEIKGLGYIDEGLDRFPREMSGSFSYCGASLEGFPTSMKGDLFLRVDESSELRKIGRQLSGLRGNLYVHVNTDQPIPLLGFCQLKGKVSRVIFSGEHVFGVHRAAFAIIDEYMRAPDADDVSIHDVQERLIDAGLSPKYARM